MSLLRFFLDLAPRASSELDPESDADSDSDSERMGDGVRLFRTGVEPLEWEDRALLPREIPGLGRGEAAADDGE